MLFKDGKFADFIFASIEHVVGKDYKKHAVAIEVGAGMGRFSFTLVNNFKKVILIEPAKAFAKVLKQQFNKKHVLVAKTTVENYFAKRKVPKNSIFFGFHLLHHLTKAQRKKLFSLISNSKSSAIFVDPNPWNPLLLVQPFFNRDMAFKQEMQYLKITKANLAKELSLCGLEVKNHETLCLLPPFLTKRLLSNKSWQNELIAFEKVRKFLPFLGSYHFFYCRPIEKA
jgi:phospholipid N-methyltransferase